MADWIAAHQFLLSGIIFMAVIGPAVGNYACSVIYRLPRGQTPFERHPYCGHCGADLKPIDLFPILSWCATRGHCRYCGGAIPGIYTLVELACGAAFIAYFVAFGVSEVFLLAAAYAVFVVILAGIQWQQGFIAATVYSYAYLAVALLRSMMEGTIYGWLTNSFLVLVGCLLAQRLHAAFTGRQARPFDAPWIWWLVLIAAWLPLRDFSGLAIPVALLLVFRFLCREAAPWVLFPVAGFALLLPTLL